MPDTKLAVLIGLRCDIELEILKLQGRIMEKQQAVQALNATIELVRESDRDDAQPETVQSVLRAHKVQIQSPRVREGYPTRLSWDMDRVKASILELLLSGSKPNYSMSDIKSHLIYSGLAPNHDKFTNGSVITRIRFATKSIPGVHVTGDRIDTRYSIVRTDQQ